MSFLPFFQDIDWLFCRFSKNYGYSVYQLEKVDTNRLAPIFRERGYETEVIVIFGFYIVILEHLIVLFLCIFAV